MTSAANRAARPLTGASRNRPSHTTSPASGSGLTGGGNGSNSSSRAPSSSESDGPRFLQDLQSQYESLSDKLARENAEQNNGSSTPPTSASSSGNGAKIKTSRKVRWAETAAIASTLDTTHDNNNDDLDYEQREPMDVLSEIFQRRYTLPIVLLLTTGIFLLVHFVGRPNPNNVPMQGDANTGIGRSGFMSRSFGVMRNKFGNEDGYRDRDEFGEHIPFSCICADDHVLCSFNSQPSLLWNPGTKLSDSLSYSSLQPSTIDESSLVPTIAVIHHTTPKISPLGIARQGALDPDYIVIPTSSGTNPGGDEDDEGNRTTLKFTSGNGGK